MFYEWYSLLVYYISAFFTAVNWTVLQLFSFANKMKTCRAIYTDSEEEDDPTLNLRLAEKQKNKMKTSKKAVTSSKEEDNLTSDLRLAEKPKGLPNIGMTCFMNSTLQCLIWTPMLRQQLETQTVTVKQQSEKHRRNKDSTTSITISLLELINDVHAKGTQARSYSQRDVVPRSILNNFLHAIRKRNSQFRGYDQQDSFEMFNTIVSGIEEEMLAKEERKDTQKNEKDKDVEKGESELLTDNEHVMNLCPVSRLFGGMFVTVYSYSSCNHIETVFQRFTSVCVPVPEEALPMEQCYVSGRVGKRKNRDSDEKPTPRKKINNDDKSMWGADESFISDIGSGLHNLMDTCEYEKELEEKEKRRENRKRKKAAKREMIENDKKAADSNKNFVPSRNPNEVEEPMEIDYFGCTLNCNDNENEAIGDNTDKMNEHKSSTDDRVENHEEYNPSSNQKMLQDDFLKPDEELTTSQADDPVEKSAIMQMGGILKPGEESITDNTAEKSEIMQRNDLDQDNRDGKNKKVETTISSQIEDKKKVESEFNLPNDVGERESGNLSTPIFHDKIGSTETDSEGILLISLAESNNENKASTCPSATPINDINNLSKTETCQDIRKRSNIKPLKSPKTKHRRNQPEGYEESMTDSEKDKVNKEIMNTNSTAENTTQNHSAVNTPPDHLNMTCFKTLSNPVSDFQTRMETGLADLTKIEQFSTEELPCRTQGCKELREAGRCFKKLMILSPPPVLVLQINRFQQSPYSGHLQKIQSEVSYPEELDLTPFVSRASQIIRDESNITYSLYGVVCHSGSLHGGHYYAFVKTSPRNVLLLKDRVFEGNWSDPERMADKIEQFLKTENKSGSNFSETPLLEAESTTEMDKAANRNKEYNEGNQDEDSKLSPSTEQRDPNETITHTRDDRIEVAGPSKENTHTDIDMTDDTTGTVWYYISDSLVYKQSDPVGALQDHGAYILMYERN